MSKNEDEPTALNNVLAKEIAADIEGFTDTLYDIAKRKAVEEHNNDMVTVLSLLFLLTKDQPAQPSHQVVLDLMKKYHVPPPPDVKLRPGSA